MPCLCFTAGRWPPWLVFSSAADDATPEMPSLCRLQLFTVVDNLLCHKRGANEYLLIETVCVFLLIFFYYVLFPSVC